MTRRLPAVPSRRLDRVSLTLGRTERHHLLNHTPRFDLMTLQHSTSGRCSSRHQPGRKSRLAHLNTRRSAQTCLVRGTRQFLCLFGRRLQHTALPTATGLGLGFNSLTADSPARLSLHSASVIIRALPGDHWLFTPKLRSRNAPASCQRHPYLKLGSFRGGTRTLLWSRAWRNEDNASHDSS